ncbi:nitroreductase family deazaflavin-dependent oxidoreductase [Pseudonocardia spinosispora]|uniref:nitroreductase family deazaflavin-dependent oxidoreductase n=1 Tax=Pseudonocardia spinosispora TaxID=103441 RepID=UPI00041CBC28|nr:nitroreductase family deazaflavin-dependent oxidoreductase [Pseudonocardia spinosispora]
MSELDEFDFEGMNRSVITEFRANDGKVGGVFADFPVILVHNVGAKSGTERINPLVYLPDGDRIFVFASKGGYPKHPAWYHNLRAHPRTTVEVGSETFPVRARFLEGQEREEIFAKQVAVAPQFGEYQQKTEREIPVIELERLAP